MLTKSGLYTEELDHLLTRVQDGVVSRRQLVELGAREHDVARLLRRRELVAAHPGVYVNHNGPLTWEQRAWVAVLACWPAALCHRSAFPDPVRADLIHVAVGHRRTVHAPDRVVVHRMTNLELRTNWMLAPPRVRLEHAAIDVAIEQGSVADRFRVLADACQTRETSAKAITEALATRRRVSDVNCSPTCSATSPAERARSWSVGISSWSVGTGYRWRTDSERTGSADAWSTGTRRTRTADSSSSSTVARSTTTQRPGIAMPIATWTPSSTTTRPPSA